MIFELIAQSLLVELRGWAACWKKYHRNQQERPSVRADHYMILRSPAEYSKHLRDGCSTNLLCRWTYREFPRVGGYCNHIYCAREYY